MANQRICSVDGCGKNFIAKGYCQKHYRRFVKYGDPVGGPTFIGEPENYLRTVILAYDGDECLPWPYSRNNMGYSQIRVGGKAVLVSRIVCQEVNGPPPTPSHEAAHSCGKGHEGCVSPHHLKWATHAENMDEKFSHGTVTRGENHGMSKLTSENVLEIISLKGKETQASIAKRFGVTRTAISRIHLGKQWGWLVA